MSPELRDRLLYYAWRAPSPHNAQGWRIEADGLNFRVSRDPDRQVLRELDPEGRESDLACGAVVTNLCTGARAFGFEVEVRWRPAAGVAADVTLVPGLAPDLAARARLQALRRRAMNRSPYRPEILNRSTGLSQVRHRRTALGDDRVDLLLRPPVARLRGLDFKGGIALIDAGYRYAAEELSKSGLAKQFMT